MDIKLFVNITSRAWALPILSSLHRGIAGRQAPLRAVRRSADQRRLFVNPIYGKSEDRICKSNLHRPSLGLIIHCLLLLTCNSVRDWSVGHVGVFLNRLSKRLISFLCIEMSCISKRTKRRLIDSCLLETSNLSVGQIVLSLLVNVI